MTEQGSHGFDVAGRCSKVKWRGTGRRHGVRISACGQEGLNHDPTTDGACHVQWRVGAEPSDCREVSSGIDQQCRGLAVAVPRSPMQGR